MSKTITYIISPNSKKNPKTKYLNSSPNQQKNKKIPLTYLVIIPYIK
jgi:hypothetical protein